LGGFPSSPDLVSTALASRYLASRGSKLNQRVPAQEFNIITDLDLPSPALKDIAYSRILPYRSIVFKRSLRRSLRTTLNSTSTGFNFSLSFPTILQIHGPWLLSLTDIQHYSIMDAKHKYSVILPTYNERRNLPIAVFLIHDSFTKK
jgi:hypothetical protein